MSGGADARAMYGAAHFARSLEPALGLMRLVVVEMRAAADKDDAVQPIDVSCWAQMLDWLMEQAEEGRADLAKAAQDAGWGVP